MRSPFSILQARSAIHALARIADALEEGNRLQRRALGLPDPDAVGEFDAEIGVEYATDAASYAAEQEDERRNRDF